MSAIQKGEIVLKRTEKIEKSPRLGKDEQIIHLGPDKTIQRAKAEIAQNHTDGKINTSLETQLRDRSKVNVDGESSLKKIGEVQRLEQRFQSKEQLTEYRQQAWKAFTDSSDGKRFMQQIGGKENLTKLMNEGRQYNFETRSAALCEKAGLNDDATGRVVHRLAELYTLEKNPQEIIDGRYQVEQRINYIDRNNISHHVELDNVTHLTDGRIIIRDYKPVNLSNFERTSSGKSWVNWVEKNVGPDFREKIQAGASPFFNVETNGSMPREIRAGLQAYLKQIESRHHFQLDKYKELYSKATGIDRSNIKTAVIPYFKFSNFS